MTENKDLEKRLEADFASQATRDAGLDVSAVRAGVRAAVIENAGSRYPYYIAAVLLAVIAFTIFEISNILSPAGQVPDAGNADARVVMVMPGSGAFMAVPRYGMLQIAAALFAEALALFIAYLILERLFFFVLSIMSRRPGGRGANVF